MRMKKKMYVFSLFACFMCWIGLFSTSVLAANNLVPYDDTSQSSSVTAVTASTPEDSVKEPHDYAGEIFQDVKYSEDPAVTGAVSSVAKVLSWIITLHSLSLQHLFCHT